MTLRDDLCRAIYPWVERPKEQSLRHLLAAKRSVTPVEGNNDFRKILAAGLFTIWAVLTLAQGFGLGSISPVWYGVMTAVIYTIIGIQWGFELENMPLAVDVSRTDEDDE